MASRGRQATSRNNSVTLEVRGFYYVCETLIRVKLQWFVTSDEQLKTNKEVNEMQEKQPKGTTKVTQRSDTETGRSLVTFRPKDIQLIITSQSLVGDKGELQEVFLDNRERPVILRLTLEEMYKAMNEQEES